MNRIVIAYTVLFFGAYLALLIAFYYPVLLLVQVGETALHYACSGNNLEIAKWLLEHMTSKAVLWLNRVCVRVCMCVCVLLCV